ncbi:hypothetical protein DMUE_3241 [Dictyocoela muelleri]|nr:hypothetical protein DMUE_3241 [Dictyocoela muelleri]
MVLNLINCFFLGIFKFFNKKLGSSKLSPPVGGDNLLDKNIFLLTPQMKRETIIETVVLKMMTASKTNVLRNLRVLGVLRSKESCSSCKKDMGSKDITDHIDGQAWVCNNYHCGDYKNTISIRQGSIFANF